MAFILANQPAICKKHSPKLRPFAIPAPFFTLLSFPEDCARLKLSSARASQAGLKEMMMQMKNEGLTK